MNKTFNVFAVTFGILACFLILWSDFKMPDFLQVPNNLIKSALDQSPLTPKPGAREQPVLKGARTLLVDLPQPTPPEYVYAPVISILFSPFRLLSPSWTLFLWQFLSMIALIVSVYAVVRLHEDAEDWNHRTIVLSFASLAFLPVTLCLKSAGIDLLAGVLPLSLGYFLLAKKKPIKAGLILSLTLLKPQFLLPAAFLSAAMIVDKKRQKCLVSMLVALIVLLIIDAVGFGQALGKEALSCLRLDFDATNPNCPAPQMVASLPGSLMLLLPSNQLAVLKPMIYCFAIFLGSLAFISVLRLWQVRMQEEKKLAITLILGIFIAPFVIPQFFVNEFCALTLAGIVALCAQWSPGGYWEFKTLVRMPWLLINLYCLPLFFKKVFVYPILLIFFLLLFYRRLLIISETIRTKESIPEVPIVGG
jgi:hypothetical protein